MATDKSSELIKNAYLAAGGGTKPIDYTVGVDTIQKSFNKLGKGIGTLAAQEHKRQQIEEQKEERKAINDFNKKAKEYQDKMKGMYDSEGKILKDKKEQHDKLQTEEAELRKKTNQNYLKEQGTLYAQLVKDKTSAEKRAEKGRSIDPFSPDTNDVKDSPVPQG